MRDATRNATQANGTCWCEWGCPHCMQATSKEKCSNLRMHRIARPVWIGPQIEWQVPVQALFRAGREIYALRGFYAFRKWCYRRERIRSQFWGNSLWQQDGANSKVMKTEFALSWATLTSLCGVCCNGGDWGPWHYRNSTQLEELITRHNEAVSVKCRNSPAL